MTREGVELLEDAFHLLRRCTVQDLLCYFTGTAPFVVASLLFIEDAAQSAESRVPLPVGSFLLALLFVWMYSWQALFASRLRGRLSGVWEPVPLWATIARQAAWQPTKLIVLPAALLATIPFGWTFAFYQNLLLMPPGEAARASRFAPRQNWTALGVLSIFAPILYLNSAILLFLLPQMLRVFTGIETSFTDAGAAAFLNRTVVACAAGLTYIVVDPVIKAVYALRYFDGKSVATGADLLAALKKLPAIARTLAALIAVLAFSWSAAAQPAPEPITGPALERSIRTVIAQPQYRWKEPLAARQMPGFIDEILKYVGRGVKWFGEWIGRLLGFDRPDSSSAPVAGGGPAALRPLMFALIGVAIAVVIYLIWARHRTRPTVTAAVTPLAQVRELSDPELTAADLPEDGWVRLAREKAAAGELRFALRALYLASLAGLAERGLVSLARGKSNWDYQRELRRRGRTFPDTVDAFESGLAIFERSWYGSHPVTASVFEEFESTFRRIGPA